MVHSLKADNDVTRGTAAPKAGFWPFVVKMGILGWGIPVALAVTAWDWYQGVPLNELGVPLAIRLVLFGLFGGIAFGAGMWKFSEYMHSRATESQRAS
jgi:hypothetical protein